MKCHIMQKCEVNGRQINFIHAKHLSSTRYSHAYNVREMGNILMRRPIYFGNLNLALMHTVGCRI